MRYTPWAIIRVGPMQQGAAEAGVGAGVADRCGTRRPAIVPSLVKPISTYCTWPRPWGIATRFSERVSAHTTGRPSVRATPMTRRSARR